MRRLILIPVALIAVVTAGCGGKEDRTATAAMVTNAPPADPEQNLIKGFRVPNYDDEGLMTSQLFGEIAKVLPNGNVDIRALRLVFYKYEGEERLEEMVVTSPRCVYNRAKGTAVSDAEVEIRRGSDFVVTGKGFTFSNEKRRLVILSDAKVVAVGAQKTLKSLERNNE